jgi:predicted Fe-Mo cluster-binding NifX family protein
VRIAVPTNNGTSISEHFGRCAAFLIFEIEDNRIQARERRTNGMQHSHGQGNCGHGSAGSEAPSHRAILSALAGCDVVICAGMGWRAAEALKSGGITEVVVTEPGPAEEAVGAYLTGSLTTRPEALCRCLH